MTHVHLHAEEIALLAEDVDELATPEQRRHLEECEVCRATLDAERRTSRLLETIPHHAPRAEFADRVLSRLQARQPWHVTARQTVREWWPETPAARLAAGSVVGLVGLGCSAGLVFLATRMDRAVFFASRLLERVRGGALSAAGSTVRDALGEPAFGAIRAGGAEGAMTVLGTSLGFLVAASVGLSALATRSRRSRGAA